MGFLFSFYLTKKLLHHKGHFHLFCDQDVISSKIHFINSYPLLMDRKSIFTPCNWDKIPCLHRAIGTNPVYTPCCRVKIHFYPSLSSQPPHFYPLLLGQNSVYTPCCRVKTQNSILPLFVGSKIHLLPPCYWGKNLVLPLFFGTINKTCPF